MKTLLILLGLVLSLALVAGCNGAQSQVATGVVLTVDQPTAGQVDGFTLRTSDGHVMTFTVGVVDQDEGAFPPQHLTEHMQTADPVKVTYKVQDGKNVATKLQDADEGSGASGAPNTAASMAASMAASGAPTMAASGTPTMAASGAPSGAH